MTPAVERVVALGASNLTRGLPTLASSARAACGADVEIVAALGHGRSYGSESRVLVRTLPGILQCGLWRHLDRNDAAVTRALVTDIGNDILYGFTAAQILAWVDEAVDRLTRFTGDITITDLPLATIRGLTPARFLFFRSLFFPACRLSCAEVMAMADQISAGLLALADARGLRFCPLDPGWYGIDPIHIRPRLWRTAWAEFLGMPSDEVASYISWLEALRLYLTRPEREWLFGIERHTPQTGVGLRGGGRVWLY